MRGQDHVTRTLTNSIDRGKIGHAFLFTGPRGVGKTSVSRILAKALNCVVGPTKAPCGECQPCQEIVRGSSLAVREIDGASHNGVDHIRELVDSVRSLPPPGYRYKVFIIDEVHMLSIAAFNALLKCLEEPPPNTVFILATTEVHKIPDTVISRCQRHDFRALPLLTVRQELEKIAEREGFTVEKGALEMISRLSEGSMRDAQTLLDRVHAYCSGQITEKETGEILGAVQRAALDSLSRSVLARDPASALDIVEQIFQSGVDPNLLCREFAMFWRELLLMIYAGAAQLDRVGISEIEKQSLAAIVAFAKECGCSGRDFQDLSEIAREGSEKALRSVQPRFAFEALVVRMATRVPVQDLAPLLHQFSAGSKGAGLQRNEPQRPTTSAVPVRSVVATARPPALKEPLAKRASGADLFESQGQLRTNGSLALNADRNPDPEGDTAKPNPEAPRMVLLDPARDSSQSVEGSIAEKKPSFIWPEFVKFVAGSKHKVLGDYIKRVSCKPLSDREITVQGGRFEIGALGRPEAKELFQKLLFEFTGSQLLVNLEVTETVYGTAVGSVEHERVRTRVTEQARQRSEIEEHPAVKAVTKAFPGSQIERIEKTRGGSEK